MLENIRLSFQGIWSHKLRSFLTMLGIIIGIASIISIVSTINGTNEQIRQNLIGSGNNVVTVQLYQNDSEYPYDLSYEPLPEGIGPVDEKTYQDIASLPDVEDASAYNHRSYADPIYYGNTSLSSADIYGVDNNYFSTYKYTLKSGRTFVPVDMSEYKPVAIIDSQAAKNLFPDSDPIGQTVEFRSTAFVIIGVVEETSENLPVITSLEEYYLYMQDSTAGKFFLPVTVWPSVFSYDEPMELAVRAASTDAMTTVGNSVSTLLNEKSSNQSVIYKAQDLLQRARELQDLSNAANQQLIWIASISLLVGGIGVMNIMLVSVTERTREIGLKKAIGAKKRRIRLQFLTEASVLTSLGGIFGVIAGVGLSHLVSSLTKTPSVISFPAIIIAVVFSMLIGIIFGLIPSIKAANLNPIDALRHE